MASLPKWIKEKRVSSDTIKGWRVLLSTILDQSFTSAILNKGERTAWISSYPPSWLSSMYKTEVWSCMVRPIIEDDPIRIEVLVNTNDENLLQSIDIALGSLSLLTNHGLPIAIPTVILEADDRAKLSNDHLETVVDQLSISLGIPKDHLRKRRAFASTLRKL
ncbi:MAG: hypothetical protein ACXAD7_21755 [Candidatus Kariarchaeaceae archaeon]|jgi:hypothetical protein